MRVRVTVYCIGKTKAKYLREGEVDYQKRLGHYLPVTFETIPDVKSGKKLSPTDLKQQEAARVLHRIGNTDRVILLDEAGTQYDSVEFARWMEAELQRPARRLVFVIGGAFGFGEALYARADGKLSLSSMTFSHQMVRLFLYEQLYRAMTILRNEKYHNA